MIQACPINLRTQWLEVGSPPWSVVTREFSGKHEMPGERVKHTYPAMVKDTQDHIVKRVFAQTLKGLHAARQVEAQRSAMSYMLGSGLTCHELHAGIRTHFHQGETYRQSHFILL